MAYPVRGALYLGAYEEDVARAWEGLRERRVMERIWARDHTVWGPSPVEVADRLGWLDSPRGMASRLPEMEAVVREVRAAGMSSALLLGMGGSSLAPEVFRKTFGVAPGFLDLAILDSTDPGAVLERRRSLNPAATLYIVSTKSGGTVETLSLLKYFYSAVAHALGPGEAGRHFIAVTDPGSGLADLARSLAFRHVFYNDPHIGGRYSALSCFGLVPAALMGVDCERLLGNARRLAEAERVSAAEEGLCAASLGCALGELARKGRDKLTFLLPDGIPGFGDWLEQLIAESTGKRGAGILPVVGEPRASCEGYGSDRFFVAVQTARDPLASSVLGGLTAAGHPVAVLEMDDSYDLGAQCLLWELATAVAGERLGINPFDQPDVEAAKVMARQVVAQSLAAGRLVEEMPDWSDAGVEVYGDPGPPREALVRLLQGAAPGAYVAVQAYLTPSAETDEALAGFRSALRDRSGLAVTVGYGPRYLHSTGQLHKGDAGRGLFLQITADDSEDAPIPDEAGESPSSLTFGTLKAAQALGDRRALLEAGRRVLRIHLKNDTVRRLRDLLP